MKGEGVGCKNPTCPEWPAEGAGEWVGGWLGGWLGGCWGGGWQREQRLHRLMLIYEYVIKIII